MSPVEVTYDEAGPEDGPVVVLSGSLGTTRAMWEAQVGPLADAGFRVVRYDTRGHGASPVPDGPYSLDDLGGDALALIDHLGADRVRWVGVSLGGMIGMWLATNAPERIERLVLCCTSAYMIDKDPWRDRQAIVREAGTTEVLADAVIARWVTDAFKEQRPEDFAALRAMFASTPPEGYAGCCAAIGAMDLRGGLGSITAPTLVIGGEVDTATPPADHAAVIAAGIPGARYELVPGAHLSSIEYADTVNRLIIEHLGGDA